MGFSINLSPIGDVFKSFGDSKYINKVEEAKKKEAEIMNLVAQFNSTDDPEQQAVLEQKMDQLLAEAKVTVDDPNFISKAQAVLQQTVNSRPTQPRSIGKVSDTRGNYMLDPNKEYAQSYELPTGFKDIYGPSGSRVYDTTETVSGKGGLETIQEYKRIAEMEDNAYKQYVGQNQWWLNDPELIKLLPKEVQEKVMAGDVPTILNWSGEISRLAKKETDAVQEMTSPTLDAEHKYNRDRAIEDKYYNRPFEEDIKNMNLGGEISRAKAKQTASLLNANEVNNFIDATDPKKVAIDLNKDISRANSLIDQSQRYRDQALAIKQKLGESSAGMALTELETTQVNGVPGVENTLDLYYQLNAVTEQVYPDKSNFVKLSSDEQREVLDAYTNGVRSTQGSDLDPGFESYVDSVASKLVEYVFTTVDGSELDVFDTSVKDYNAVRLAARGSADTSADVMGEAVIKAMLNPDVYSEIDLPVSPNFDPAGTGITVGDEAAEYVDQVERLLMKQKEEGLTDQERTDLKNLVRKVGTIFMKYKPAIPDDTAFSTSNPPGEIPSYSPESPNSLSKVALQNRMKNQEPSGTPGEQKLAELQNRNTEPTVPTNATPFGELGSEEYNKTVTTVDKILKSLSANNKNILVKLASGEVSGAVIQPIINALNNAGSLNFKQQNEITGATKQMIMDRAEFLLKKEAENN